MSPFRSFPVETAGVSIEGPSGPRAKLRAVGRRALPAVLVVAAAFADARGAHGLAFDALLAAIPFAAVAALAAFGDFSSSARTPSAGCRRSSGRSRSALLVALLRSALAGDADARAPAARRVGARRLPRGARAEALPRDRAVPAARGNRDREAVDDLSRSEPVQRRSRGPANRARFKDRFRSRAAARSPRPSPASISGCTAKNEPTVTATQSTTPAPSRSSRSARRRRGRAAARPPRGSTSRARSPR